MAMTNPFEQIEARLSNIESLLIDIKHGGKSLAAQTMLMHGRVMTLTELVAYCGISKSTVYKMTASGEMPHSKRAKRLYFDRDRIDAWLLERQTHTKSETEKDVNQFLATNRSRMRIA